MTARQEARVRSRGADAGRWSYETQRAPHVGELLLMARERKGIDLARAERETKIRARHLAALEAGDFSALPAQVYAKGFLRNYATYLELDAEEMLARWRREVDQPASGEVPRVKPPPQPITAPGRGLKFTGGLFVAFVLATVVFLFVGYIGLQLVRFTQNPAVELNGPSIRQLQPGAERLVLSGTATPNAIVTASGADDLVRTTTATPRGAWTLDLPVSKGQNTFTIVTTDAQTARESEPLQVLATVPFLQSEVGAAGGPALPAGVDPTNLSGAPSAELTLTAPREGAESRDGKVKVEGTSDAQSVLLSAQWLGKADQARPAPRPVELAVAEGVFRGHLQLPKGRWQVSVAAAIDGGTPAIVTVPVRSLNDRMVVTVSAVDGFSRVKLFAADGEEVIADTMRLEPGQSRTFRVDPLVLLKVGNAKAAHVTIDGVDYGSMGKKAESMTWRIRQGERPRKVP
jgi:cytoskeletal protein RodZ